MSNQTPCSRVSCLLEPFLDGELDNATVVDVDEHLGQCEPCRERASFSRAVKSSVRRSCSMSAPFSLRAKLNEALQREARESGAALVLEAAVESKPTNQAIVVTTPEVNVMQPPRLRKVWDAAKTWVPVSTAAAALLFAWSSQHRPQARPLSESTLRELVAEHSHPLPPERTDPSEVRALERYVGVPVQLPFAKNSKARLVGGRVMPLQTERAAMLQYELERGGSNIPQRVSVFIYDPARIQVDNEDLRARSVGSAQVRVGRANGYSVAVAQHNGVGYALASDMDPEVIAEMVGNVE